LFEVPPFRKFDTRAPDFEERLAQLFREPNLTILSRKYSMEEAPDRDRVHFLKSLGVRSERELGRKAQLWTVEEKTEVFNVELWIESPSRGLEIDRTTTDAFEKNMRLERVTAFLIEKLND